MRHFKNETEYDVMKKENQARVKRFLIAIDKAAHGEYMNGKTFTDESSVVSISSMAVEATEALRFSA